MNITNINTESGVIYFHANSVPYLLENVSNFSVIQKLAKKIDGEIINNEADGFVDIIENSYIHLIENYILELKSDWIEIDSSDTDNYLSEIDEAFFYSNFCNVFYDKFCDTYHFQFKVNNEFVCIQFIPTQTINIANSEFYKLEESRIYSDYDANEIFQTMYRKSNSYLSVVAKEILIRSHQDFLYSKKQIVVV